MSTIIQAGSSLQLLDAAGVLTTLTLPTRVTLRTDVPPRWARYQYYVVLVNTPSQPLTIDGAGTVRLLSPKPPRFAPVLSGTGSSTLTGNFRSKLTFVTLDTFGNIISESDFSPVSLATSITNQFLLASNLDVSPDQITARRLYRTTDSGAVYFQWIDLDGNILTSIQDNLNDAGLSIVGATRLGTPPRLTTIAEFRGRLFGSGDVDIDNLRYTEAGLPYSWPADNLLPIPAIGGDAYGVVGLLPRREALGVGRRNMLVQITGSGAQTTTGGIDFDIVILSKELGIESQESLRVFNDIAYFLWQDGVYEWSSEGIRCISDGTPDGKGNVRSWFATGNYFNRDMFPKAFAHIVAVGPKYRLYLASAGSTTIDRWVEFDLKDRTWWGPHKTDLFSPTSAFNSTSVSDIDMPLIGSAFSVFKEQTIRTDGNPASLTTASSETAIAFDVIGKRHTMQVPDQDKYFGEVSLLGRAQTDGTLSVISRAGELNQTQTKTQYYDMRKTRHRLGRLGTGKHAQLELVNAETGKDVEVFGYEVDPVNLLGRR